MRVKLVIFSWFCDGLYIFGLLLKEPSFAGSQKVDISQIPVCFHSNGTTRVVVFVCRSTERPPWILLGLYRLAAVVAANSLIDRLNGLVRSSIH